MDSFPYHQKFIILIRKSYLLLVFGLLCILPVQAEEIMVLGLFKDMAIVRIDGVQQTLRAGKTNAAGIKLISADSETAVLEINGKRERFGLGSHQSTAAQKKKDYVEARIWANSGMYMTTGVINGLPVNLLVDTGATWVAMNAAQARRLGIDYKKGKKTYAGTAKGRTETYLVKLKSVKVGQIEVNHIEGAVIEGQGPSTVLLGMSFLSKVKMQREGELLLLSQQQ